MNNTIWKFELETKDNQTIQIPKDAEILTAQIQKGKLCLWVLVNPELEKEDRNFEVFGTGHKMPLVQNIIRNYISTYQLQGGNLVFHLFERVG